MSRKEISIGEVNVKIRIFTLFVVFVLAYGFLSYRLFLVQFLHNDRYLVQARNQQVFKITLPARRGQILDRNSKILATSVPAKSLYAVPCDIDNPVLMADLLAPVVGVDRDVLARRFSRDKKFVWVKRRMTDEELAALESLGELEGLGFIEEQHRVYPNNELLSQVIGFVDIDSVGREGIERSMRNYLDGRPGERVSMKDAKGREIISKVMESVPPVDGCNVQLTIDAVIQHVVERELEWGVEKFNPQGASAVVMDVNTGEVLAMANRPTFDPNNIRSSTAEERRNRAVTDIFEPGSIFKIVTLSAALDDGLVKAEDEVFCEYGSWSVPGHVLNDTHAYGKLSVRDVLKKSSNIGTAKVALMLGKEKLYEHAADFGFGSATGIELPGEMGGVLHPVSRWSRLSIYCLPMGHEITVNTMQIMRAFCAIANGGQLMRPLVFKNVTDPEGRVIRSWEPTVERRVLFADTSRAVTDMLSSVVNEDGTGRKAAVKGYRAAGKTGTAQKLLPSGRGYSHSDYFASFVGFLPADDPKVCIGVFFDAPKPVYYGGSVAGPVFSRIGEAVMAYLGVPPERGKEGGK